jgi:cation:H+ antiporter
MWFDIIGLVIGLCIILMGCELFTNGVEWLGKLLKLGDGVVGSIFSAVGTCLPETLVPVIAIFFSGNGSNKDNSIEVGIGAIMGAPFMLSTLAFFITGASVLFFWKRRKSGIVMNVKSSILSRDLGFFILVYSVGISASFIASGVIKLFIAMFLIACYIFYVVLTVRSDKTGHNEVDALYATRFANVKPGVPVVLLQIALGLSCIVFGANLFVMNLKGISELIGVSALVLSLIITPVATELPEKFNSILWISRKKDTLALGNISGAMVFQSCIPVSFGILFTSWELEQEALVSAVLAILSSSVTYLWLKTKGKLNPLPLIAGGAFYAIYIYYLVAMRFN